MRFLLFHGADANSEAGPHACTAFYGLIFSADAKHEALLLLSKVDFFLEHGATVLLLTKVQASVVNDATACGLVEVLQLLLVRGSNFDSKKLGFTPLIVAALHRHLDISRFLG